MTDDDMTKVAEILRRQLHGATPEQYTFIRGVVFDIYVNFDTWFSDTDPDFLPDRFHDLIFEGYPVNLYNGGEEMPDGKCDVCGHSTRFCTCGR